MRIITTFIVSVMLMFTFAACGPETVTEKPTDEVTVTETPETETETPTPEPEPETDNIEDIYLQDVRANVPEVAGADDQTLLNIAYGNCDLFAAGATFEEVAQVGLDEGVSPTSVGYIIGAGTEAFCPEYSHLIG